MKRLQAGQSPQVTIDWSQVTPYDVIRIENCKTSKFLHKEIYPNIRPPVSKCCNEQTKVWLADAVENAGCCRSFGTEQNDDILDVWKQTPHKHTLGCYGVVGDIPQPEAIVFNKVMSKCLNMVNGQEETKSKKSKKVKVVKCRKPKGAYVLNRKDLQTKLNTMPIVKRKLAARNALSWLHCNESEPTDFPFLDDGLQDEAIDMESSIKQPKHGLRRNHKYCAVQCDLPQNKCTEYEWKKYQMDPTAADVALKMELDEIEDEAEPQPRNYDELYRELITCFQKTCDPIPLCKTYGKCCRLPSERKYIQGCGEQKSKPCAPCAGECECG